MSKRIKFKFQELEVTNKVLVYIDYIDRNFFNDNFYEEWEYNNIEFSIRTYKKNEEGCLDILYNDLGKIDYFTLNIGTKENCFIINKNEVNIFKDLENIVYNDNKRPLSNYLINNKYYYIYLIAKNLKYDLDFYNLDKDGIDRDYFLSGNMFKTKKEAEEMVKKLNNEEITIKDMKKERQEFFKNYIFD